MGSYAQCWLGNFFIGSSRDDVDPSLIHLFRSEDKRFSSEITDDLPECLHRWFDGDEDELEVVYYKIPASCLRDRLELRGYTLENCRRAFELALAQELMRTKQWATERSEIQCAFSARVESLSFLTSDRWLQSLVKIRDLKLESNHYSRLDKPTGDPVLDYMLSEEWYGLPGPDRNVGLRLALESTSNDESFVYDVTDLVLSDCFDRDEDIVEYDLRVSANEFSSRSRIIVLTEGRTDSWILSESLSLLYPHLSGYFSFLDFDGSRTAGGVGNLVNLVKAFAGSGIVNRMIAIFDNDTAAAAALRSIAALKLPRHIAILRLPDLDYLENYPTLGPTGVVRANVNGLATSIELILGRDVLSDAEYGFVPIQWTGYEQGLKQYQGEVINKPEIHDRFREKLSHAKQQSDPYDAGEWAGLEKLFRSFFSAFNDMDGEEICQIARLYS